MHESPFVYLHIHGDFCLFVFKVNSFCLKIHLIMYMSTLLGCMLAHQKRVSHPIEDSCEPPSEYRGLYLGHLEELLVPRTGF